METHAAYHKHSFVAFLSIFISLFLPRFGTFKPGGSATFTFYSRTFSLNFYFLAIFVVDSSSVLPTFVSSSTSAISSFLSPAAPL